MLTPGVVRGPGGLARFGGQNFGDGIQADGASNNNPLSGQNFVAVPYQISLSAIDEFQVNTSGYPAELGRVGTGVVNVVTKSGTNEFHGSASWYFRDKGLNATDPVRKFNGISKEPLHVHQFGAQFGGPLHKDKIFFVAAYDGQRRNLGNGAFLSLPAGFQLSSNATTAVFQQRALDYLVPRASPYVQTNNEDSYFARVDWHLTPTQIFATRWNSARVTNLNGSNNGPQNSLEHTGTSSVSNDSLALSLTSVISSTAVNVARFNYLGNANSSDANTPNPQANIFEAGQLVLTIGRPVNGPQSNSFHQTQWSDTISLSRGRHALKFGAQVILTSATNLVVRNFFGNYRFNSLASFGRSLAGTPLPQAGENYVQGFSGLGEPGITSHPDSHDFGGFVEDEWQLRSGFTLNLGLRYDVQLMAKPEVRNPDPWLAAAGLDTSFVPLDLTKIAPRLGFAWSPLANHRLVVRSGYGIFSSWLPSNVAVRAHFQNGISVQTRTFTPGTPSGAFIPAYPNTICGPPDPDGAPPSCAPPLTGVDTLMLFSPTYTQPYNQHANSGLDYEFQKDVALSINYLMVKGTHLTRWRDINLSAPVPATIGIAGTSTVLTYNRYSAPRPIAGFDRILAIEGTANSSYHGMTLQLNKRLAQNYQLLAGYTLSKVIDDHPEPIGFDPGTASEALLSSDPFYPANDRGLGVADARHRFVLSGVWELRYADRLPRAARLIFGGWESSWILAVQSGLPYSGGVSFDLNNDGNALSDRTPAQSRDIFRAPSTISWDQRFTRNFRLTEHLNLQFIWETFNLLNRANYTDPRTTQSVRSTSLAVCGIAGSPCLVPQNTGLTAFGIPTDSTGPRVMQFAAKVVF